MNSLNSATTIYTALGTFIKQPNGTWRLSLIRQPSKPQTILQVTTR
jgi:hypothetical protein